jgi:hypothetical protein
MSLKKNVRLFSMERCSTPSSSDTFSSGMSFSHSLQYARLVNLKQRTPERVFTAMCLRGGSLRDSPVS